MGVLLRARVHDPDGPVAGATVQLTATNGAALPPLTTTADGLVESGDVPPGRYTATATHEQRASTPQLVDVPRSGTVQLEFVLTPR